MFHYRGAHRESHNHPAHQQQQQMQQPSPQRNVRVTPAFVRSLMPRVQDEENECFQWNRRKFYEAMEVEARNRRWEVTYAVPDMDAYDVHVLDAVFQRMIGWLRSERFDVRADSTRPRSFVASWDPARTPASITSAEQRNKGSNAMIRLRTVERALRHSEPDLEPVEPQQPKYFSNASPMHGAPSIMPQPQSQPHPQSNVWTAAPPPPWLFNQWLQSAQIMTSQQQQQQQQQWYPPREQSHPMQATRATRAANFAGAITMSDAVRDVTEQLEASGGGEQSEEQSDEQQQQQQWQQPMVSDDEDQEDGVQTQYGEQGEERSADAEMPRSRSPFSKEVVVAK